MKKQYIKMNIILYQIELRLIALFQNKIKTLIKNQEYRKIVYLVQFIIIISINRIFQMK